ncbi:DNA-binding response regulator [Mucilaginibacter conchicola]|uniref:DNA-binding response regulator n=1 Tax=Mucilaginibacter conchicola TaxID=2303333 RepID=A0A372NST2_9SPHI|nr:LuxR C-terminal-related transcriptional regulator [Mucilaginibacter conchicola]RFZ91333.1 DNA-binding response regulator [Mucilaginibacter conchicola]
MVINNHMRPLLDIKLFSQPFNADDGEDQQLDTSKVIARHYAELEHGISVLSDIKMRKSYVYHGGLAEQLGIDLRHEVIDSIWEDELLNRVHREDLERKYRLEFRYFQMLKTMEPMERTDHSVITRLRIKDQTQRYLSIQHRLIYIGNATDGGIRLALCLYNRHYDLTPANTPYGVIVNNRTGEIIETDHYQLNGLLSSREKEVLQQMKAGKRSKEIATDLSLSVFTVNRHRQNIFKKLEVSNAIEACRMVEYL